VAPVDLVGAGRELMGRKIANRLADRIRGFAEVKIEHPLRVGNHGRVASRSARTTRQSLIRWRQPCHATERLRREIGVHRAAPQLTVNTRGTAGGPVFQSLHDSSSTLWI